MPPKPVAIEYTLTRADGIWYGVATDESMVALVLRMSGACPLETEKEG